MSFHQHMRSGVLFLSAILVISTVQAQIPKPPASRVDNFREVIHGVEIVDPYRWLEETSNVLEKLFAEQYPNLPAEIQNLLPREFLTVFAKMSAPSAVSHAPEVLDGFTEAISTGFYKGFNENIGGVSSNRKGRQPSHVGALCKKPRRLCY